MLNDMKVDLRGKVANIDLKPHQALFPLFEAVVNSIQAIEERKNIQNGVITITIHRSNLLQGQNQLNFEGTAAPITGFTIEDNGIGFNSDNYESFKTSDSTYKYQLGGKGVGRFSWLKVFDNVIINSVFEENDQNYLRSFIFTLDENVNYTGDQISPTSMKVETKIHLDGFIEKYRKETHAYKKGETIAWKIFDHCFSYFIHGNAPKIFVIDKPKEDEKETKTYLSEFYDDIKDSLITEELQIGDYLFQITHVRLYKTLKNTHHIVYCGNNRDVQIESISKKLGIDTRINDDKGNFFYCAYISSEYLDQNINQERTRFTIPQERRGNSYGDTDISSYDISIDEITNEIIKQSVSPYLKECLEQIKLKKIEKVHNYVSEVNPTLRVVLPFIDEILDKITLNMSDDAFVGVLFKYKGIAEHNLIKRSNKFLKSNGTNVADVTSEANELLLEISEMQKSDLAGYVLYRYKLLELFDKKLGFTLDGNYSLEDEIHDLIFPKKKTSNEIRFEDHNLWLVDDRLAFHSFATSDMGINTFSDSDSNKRPDILVFKEDGNRGIISSATIIEFKRPERMDKDILEQIYEYIEDLREQKLLTYDGKRIHTSDETIYYCYAFCDFSKYGSKTRKLFDRGGFKALMGELGYYTYIPKYNAHIEVIDYDKLVSDAKMRNYVWFNRLGLGTK